MVSRLFDGAGARFLLAGGAAAFVNWATRMALSLVLPFETAVILAYLVGMAVGFALYRSFVFGGSDLPLPQQVLRFVAVNAAGAAAVFAAANALLPPALAFGLPQPPAEALAHGLAIGLGAFVNFAGHRAFTFSARRSVPR